MEENNKSISASDLAKATKEALLQALGEMHFSKRKDVKFEKAHYKRISEAIARLEKEKKLEEFSIFFSQINFSFNEKKFKQLNELADVELKKYLTHYADLVSSEKCSEEIVYNYFINIDIPENLFGFSKEFFLSLLITLVLFYISGKKSEKDKEEILKAIRNIRK